MTTRERCSRAGGRGTRRERMAGAKNGRARRCALCVHARARATSERRQLESGALGTTAGGAAPTRPPAPLARRRHMPRQRPVQALRDDQPLGRQSVAAARRPRPRHPSRAVAAVACRCCSGAVRPLRRPRGAQARHLRPRVACRCRRRAPCAPCPRAAEGGGALAAPAGAARGREPAAGGAAHIRDDATTGRGGQHMAPSEWGHGRWGVGGAVATSARQKLPMK